jgi:hypothetical protein
MNERDLLVAAVSIGLGLLMTYSAARNEGWCFQMTFARAIEKFHGPQAARMAIGSVGTAMILLGIYTATVPSTTKSSVGDIESANFGEFKSAAKSAH